MCSAIAVLGWAVYGVATLGLGFLAAVAFAANLKSVLAARWRAAALFVQALAVAVAAMAALFATFYAEAGRRPWWLSLLKIALWAFVAVSWGGTVTGWRRWLSARPAA